MYRIELSPGEETAIRTIEELAVAIRRGVVTSKARIWHNATSRWLPIQFHPHYKTAASMPLSQADLVAGPPITPLSALNLPDPNATAPRVSGFRPIDPPASQPDATSATPRAAPLKPASPYHQPEPHLPPAPVAGLPLIETRPERPFTVPFKPLQPKPAPAMRLAPIDEPSRKPKKKKSRRKSARRALRAALIGALFVGGANLAISAGGALRNDGLRTYRRLVAAPPEAVQWDTPRTVAAVIPSLRNSSVPARPHPGSRTTPMRTASNPVSEVSLPAMLPAPGDSTSELVAAPAIEMPVTAAPIADSLSSAKTDTTGKKVLKGILKAVSGTAAQERRTKR